MSKYGPRIASEDRKKIEEVGGGCGGCHFLAWTSSLFGAFFSSWRSVQAAIEDLLLFACFVSIYWAVIHLRFAMSQHHGAFLETTV